MQFISIGTFACQVFVANAVIPVLHINLSIDGEDTPLYWNPQSEDVASVVREFTEKHGMYDPDAAFDMSVAYQSEIRLRLLRAHLATILDDKGMAASQLPLRNGAPIREVPLKRGAVIALYGNHDANIAIGVNGRVQCVLELERLFGERYFMPPRDERDFRAKWLEALATVRDRCNCSDGPCPRRFQTGAMVVDFPPALQQIVEEVFVVEHWQYVGHAEAHALLAFHASPLRSALVIVNDSEFHVFYASLGRLERLAKLDYSLGVMFMILAGLLPEVTGRSNEKMCQWSGNGNLFENWKTGSVDLAPLGWAGKLMGYAATGTPEATLSSVVREAFEVSGAMPKYPIEDIFGLGRGKTRLPDRFLKLLRYICSSVEGQRALAASIQAEFEQITHGIVMKLVEHVGVENLDGVVLTGGCALNVLANQMIHDSLSSVSNSEALKALWVPPSPNDGGLSIGGLWAVTPPSAQQSLQYLGFGLWDEQILDDVAKERAAQRLSSLGGVEYLAELLAGGPAWQAESNWTAEKPIIAVVRGRQEFGPRALGHRSLLAVPDSEDIRDRMNRLKARQWYRPVAPMIANEALEEVFGRQVQSPYMTMAPRVHEAIRERFPALAHVDGTARHQSVSRVDEPWVHALLLAVGRRTGLATLINTSFNTKGKPIVNRIQDCLQMLDELPDLDFVVIDDWIFKKQT